MWIRWIVDFAGRQTPVDKSVHMVHSVIITVMPKYCNIAVTYTALSEKAFCKVKITSDVIILEQQQQQQQQQ